MSAILATRFAVSWKAWLRWSAGFIGFPLAGVAARAVAGNIDDTSGAVVGGLAAGVVLGAAQAVALPAGGVSRRLSWCAATTVGMAGGLAVGAGAVDYQTAPQDLIVMGAINGAAVGIAQAAVVDMSLGRRIGWAALTPALWAVGWFITSQVIVDADRQHATFGSSGAIVVAAASGLFMALRISKPSSDAEAAPIVNRKVVVS